MMVQTWLFPEYLDTACVWCLLCFFSPLFNTFLAHFCSCPALILGYLMAVFSPNIFTQRASVSVWRLPHQQHPLCPLNIKRIVEREETCKNVTFAHFHYHYSSNGAAQQSRHLSPWSFVRRLWLEIFLGPTMQNLSNGWLVNQRVQECQFWNTQCGLGGFWELTMQETWLTKRAQGPICWVPQSVGGVRSAF